MASPSIRHKQSFFNTVIATLVPQVIAGTMSASDYQRQIAELGVYKSRGKGKGLHQKANPHKTIGIKRASIKKHNITKRKRH